jgi:hypothetical protein
MASDEPKRDIADFFRPYMRSDPPKTIPAKRPSPIPGEELNGRTLSTDKQLKRTEPRTPNTASRFKNGVPSLQKSPFTPRSGASVTIAIRSPKPSPYQTPRKASTASSSTLRTGGLFPLGDREKGQEKQPLSFADIPISGQSVVKDGKVVAVKSSDDEDTDSLCSLDDILGRNRRDPATDSSSPPEVEEEDVEAQRARSLGIFTNGRSNALVGRNKLRELTSKANGLKFDISSLIGDHFDDEEIEANVTKAKQGYKVSDDQERFKQQGSIDRNLLASVSGQKEDSGDLQRLFNAVERTDALATENTWSMFKPSPLYPGSSSPQPFPNQALQPGSWSESLKDSTFRNRAFLSGYIAEVAAEGNLPDNIVTWVFNSIIRESRDDLRKCYMRVLQSASPRWTPRNLTPHLLEQTFRELGADPIAIECASIIKADSKLHTAPDPSLYTQLLFTLKTLIALLTDMAADTLSKFAKLLMRLAIDTHLMSDSRMCIVVEDVISSLLGTSEERIGTSVTQDLLSDIGLRIKDPFLQTQNLKHILPTSSIAASLRLGLAKLFLLGDVEQYTTLFDHEDPEDSLQLLTAHLHDPRYDISSSSRDETACDYNTLSSLIYIFDAALINGGRPSTFIDGSSEREFNHQVDILADRVKSIIASIADTGASHMRRTEAKEALNALHFRLLYAVRTKPRPKKSVFGGRDGAEYRAEERSVGMMQQFLDRRKEQKASKERDVKLAPGRRPGRFSQKSKSEELIRK